MSDSDVIDHTADERPRDEPFNPAIHDGPEPAYEEPGGPLTADEQGRLRELRGKSAAGLTDEENTELTGLEARMRVDQRRLAPDLPPEQVRPFPADDANRLRDLRLANERGALTDDERGEMATLGAAESEAAGHLTPEEAAAAPVADERLALHGEIVALFEHIVAVIPALRSMEPMLRRLRARYDALVNPPVDAEQPPPDKG